MPRNVPFVYMISLKSGDIATFMFLKLHSAFRFNFQRTLQAKFIVQSRLSNYLQLKCICLLVATLKLLQNCGKKSQRYFIPTLRIATIPRTIHFSSRIFATTTQVNKTPLCHLQILDKVRTFAAKVGKIIYFAVNKEFYERGAMMALIVELFVHYQTNVI